MLSLRVGQLERLLECLCEVLLVVDQRPASALSGVRREAAEPVVLVEVCMCHGEAGHEPPYTTVEDLEQDREVDDLIVADTDPGDPACGRAEEVLDGGLVARGAGGVAVAAFPERLVDRICALTLVVAPRWPPSRHTGAAGRTLTVRRYVSSGWGLAHM